MDKPYALRVSAVKPTPARPCTGSSSRASGKPRPVLQRLRRPTAPFAGGHSIWSLAGRRVVVPSHPGAWKGARGRAQSRAILRALRASRQP
jgi:hypothetical protein